MKRSIDSLKITGFRGASTTTGIAFDDKKPMVMIYGENGTGKSTIADAIDFVCNRKLGSIDFKSGATKSHLTTIGRKQKDLRVELTCAGTSWTARLDSKGVVVDPDELPPVAYVLRRNQLLRLVEAKPADRYKTIQSLIDVEAVEKSEGTLRARAKTAEKRIDELTATQVQADDSLTRIWMAERQSHESHASAREWAAARMTESAQEIEDEIKRLGRIVTVIERVRQSEERYGAALDNERRQRELLASTTTRLVDLSTSGADRDADVFQILQQTARYLETDRDLSACPVCEQGVDAADLRQRIATRLEAMSQLKEAAAALDRAREAHQKSEGAVAECRAPLIQELSKFGNAGRPSDLPILTSHRSLWERLVSLASDAEQLDNVRAQLMAEIDDIDVQTRTRAGDLRTVMALRTTIGQQLTAAIEAERDLAEAFELKTRLVNAHRIVHDTRIRFTQKILDDVASECQALYARIHPGEPLELTSLKLDEKTLGSIEQFATFQGHPDVKPQGYFSESHLDTLGFCFWLAHVKKVSGGEGVLVLDDVFSSVDAAHMSRILDLLVEESSNFAQVVITTHSRVWRDRHRSGAIPQNKCFMLDLGRWSLNQGIQTGRVVVAIDELRALLNANPINPREVASLAGFTLEQVLEHLSFIYQASLPYKRNAGHTLQELCDGWRKPSRKLRVHRPTVVEVDGEEKTQEEELELNPLIELVSATVFVRNQVGAHFSLAGLDIPDSDVATFGDYALRLLSMLSCPSCTSIVRRKRDTHFECQCGATRIAPSTLP